MAGPDDRADGRRNRRSGTLEDRRDQRRQALLAAAFDVIGTRGYRAATVEEVCRTASVSTRNFYEEFRNREDLLAELVDERMAVLSRAVAEARSAADPGDPEADTTARVEAFIHGMVDDPRVARLIIIESVGISDETERRRRAIYRSFIEQVRALAQGYADEGLIPARDFTILSTGVVGGIYEIVAEWMHDEQPMPVDELVAGARKFVRLVFVGELPEDRLES